MKTRAKTKQLSDIQHDMSLLYDEVRDGTTELKTAAELANIAGKFLKAEQLIFAREVFTSGRSKPPINGESHNESQVRALLANNDE